MKFVPDHILNWKKILLSIVDFSAFNMINFSDLAHKSRTF